MTQRDKIIIDGAEFGCLTCWHPTFWADICQGFLFRKYSVRFYQTGRTSCTAEVHYSAAKVLAHRCLGKVIRQQALAQDCVHIDRFHQFP